MPGRNILFLTLAAIYAYQVEAEAVITGVCETDFSGYPDCRDERPLKEQGGDAGHRPRYPL